MQYGVAFTGEFVTSAGAFCPTSATPCILGSGGGIAARLGIRTASPFYFGVAYEFSKQDPNKLYKLAILQQLRGEARYYVETRTSTRPYGAAGAGVAGYGSEWSVDTAGPMGFASLGVETEITVRTSIGFALSYRGAALSSFVDPSGFERAAAFVQILGIDVCLEAKEPW